MIGTVINDRYQIEVELGQGGMGMVFGGHDTFLKRAVAIKILSNNNLDFEARQRLLGEAQAAAQLNHPNIVSVYDAGEAEGLPFIVMESAAGCIMTVPRWSSS